MILKAGLYIVSTPIGNLKDITLRALEVLQNSNVILCEDTRTSQKLLEKYNIKGNLKIYNDHSTDKNRQEIASLVEGGRSVSLISDAGTPLISDPGYKLTKLLRDKELYIDVIPGACSVIGALTISSLPSDSFFFAGFLPRTAISRKKVFTQLKAIDATLIFFENSSRISDSLQDAYQILGNREACVVRELTKLYQETRFDKLLILYEFYKQNKIKGEIVLLISGKLALVAHSDLEKELDNEIKLLFLQSLSAKDVTEKLFPNYSQYFSKKEIYNIVNKLKNNLSVT